ncbi:hypothetical protein [Nocardia brasiliensis]|uniref:hypothetical protein n=1 Tax=Nocardia brasiliensis TaxID=37326 RepID=UPI002454D462|nr:hypothetical protein [Nocardia brasiliensis]
MRGIPPGVHDLSTINDGRSYGHIWADWLYGGDKDQYMIDVYNECASIDACQNYTQKAAKLAMLRNMVHRSKKAWTEGIIDFIDWECHSMASSAPHVEYMQATEGSRALSILRAAYLHGAFRGLCRTASGAEWIGELAEYAAAAVHQGFKWVRIGNVDDWEMPSLGEAWCKGMVEWGIACLYISLDSAGADIGNDKALARMHTVIAAHHMAAFWKRYRGEHPHKTWNPRIRGCAPSADEIRMWGLRDAIPAEAVEVMAKAAQHVNTWTNRAPSDTVHLERTRGFTLGDHTPRLMARIEKLCDQLAQIVGDLSESESEEILWRTLNWVGTFSCVWRGRGDHNDLVTEAAALGALVGVLRESRDGITAAIVERALAWTEENTAHLNKEQQRKYLDKVRHMLEVRGRVPGTRYSGVSDSAGDGYLRYVDGVWDVSVWTGIYANRDSGTELSPDLLTPTVRFFNAIQGPNWRRYGKTYTVGDDPAGGCPVCVGDELFNRLVDNRPDTAVLECTIWGTPLYGNLGVGEPGDTNLGTEPK